MEKNIRHSVGFLAEYVEPRRLLAVHPFSGLAGHLDTSFGNGTGEISVPFGGPAITSVRSSVRQPDGKTVIVGQSADPNGGFDAAVARINADGTPDTTFGINGLVAAEQIGNTDTAFGVALQPDGKIVVVGSFAQIISGEPPIFAVSVVARLNTDGSVDTTFGDDGFITGDFHDDVAGATQGEARAVVIQSNGDIVVGGGAVVDTTDIQIEFARYLPDGTLDTSFADDGKLLLPELANPVEEVLGEALQPDQSILAVGTSIGNTVGEAFILRLTPDGAVDTSFGDGGGLIYQSPFDTGDGYSEIVANTIIDTPDGRLLAGGFDYESDAILGTVSIQAFVARLMPDGTTDPTFGTRGLTETDFPDVDSVQNIQLLPDGRILASGLHTTSAAAVSSGVFSPVVLQFTPNGALDTTFGTGGRALVPVLTTSAASLKTAGIQTADTSTSQQQLTGFEDQTATISLTPGGEILVIAGNSTTVTVAELIGNGPILVPAVSGIKAASVIGGAKASLVVNVNDQGNDAAAGSATITVYLSTDGTLSSDDPSVGHVSGVVKLSPGVAKKAFKLTFVYPTSLTNGNYFVLAQVTSATIADAAPGKSVAATAFAVPVTQPFVSITGQFHGTPVVTAKMISITISLTNQGNVLAKGAAQLQIFASSDMNLDAGDTALNAPTPEHVQIKSKGTGTIKIRLKRTPGAFAGDDYILLDFNFATIPLSSVAQALVSSAAPIVFS